MRDREAEADVPHGDELDGRQVGIIRQQSAAGDAGEEEPHPHSDVKKRPFLKVKDPSLVGHVLGSQILLLQQSDRTELEQDVLWWLAKPLLGTLPSAPKLECGTEWVPLLNECRPVSSVPPTSAVAILF